MEQTAREGGSVLSAVMFGALAGSGALPLPRDVFEAVIRETQEELLISAHHPSLLGLLHFRLTDGLTLACHVFRPDPHSGPAPEADP